jgi:hypothetical protein
MDIRLEGSPEQIQLYATELRRHFDVARESKTYRNRPPSKSSRRYLDIRIRQPLAAAQRTGGEGR